MKNISFIFKKPLGRNADYFTGITMIECSIICRLFFNFACVFVVTFFLLSNTAVKADHGPKTWANSHKSVVVVNPTWPGYTKPGFGAPPGTAPAGAGFYYQFGQKKTSGFIVTAAHVVKKAISIEIVDFEGKISSANIHAIDTGRDIAILKTKLKGESINVLDEKPAIGSHVCALGNSFGLGTGISCGVVSALNRSRIGINKIEDFIQTDAAVNPGMSGGALVNPKGQLVGLVDAIFTKSADIDAGVNFAISIKLLKTSIAEQIKAGKSF